VHTEPEKEEGRRAHTQRVKTTFGRQENILEEVDGIVAEEEAPLMEELKWSHGVSQLGKA